MGGEILTFSLKIGKIPHPTPYTLHPTPHTPHPTPTKNFLPQTLIIAPPIAIVALFEQRIINNFFLNGKTDKKFLSKNWQKLARRKMLISLEHLR
ncbi:MAG: hypothetical protein O9276_18340 [Microcystis sp. LE17-20A]|uniref:hypothetical protein n=1 Tax=unclassified Microcystis TaxID=2643300 RepID=UPI0022BE3037|nr:MULTISPECIES: hypothetical protein [unclassified Microcystis]MCZ8040017.1 hypothetical protein [Microcystis sp. LE17-20A]MCZ8212787.1 hypothetical protein [Microcystis sp. LE19-8.1F]